MSWSKAQANSDGVLQVSFPNVRWKSLRDTEGWAALQHHAVLKTSLTLYPGSISSPPPHLHVQLVGGSYFTILLPGTPSKEAPWWYAGNIYDMERALPRTIDLPMPPSSIDSPTTYDILVSGDYEVCLPSASRFHIQADNHSHRSDSLEILGISETRKLLCRSSNLTSSWTKLTRLYGNRRRT